MRNIIIILLLAAAFTSCNSSKKTSSSTQISNNTAQVSKSDSASEVAVHESTVKDSISTDENNIAISFFPETADSSAPAQPKAKAKPKKPVSVKVSRDKNGDTHIESDQAIKSITIKNKNQQQSTVKTESSKADSTGVSKTDSTGSSAVITTGNTSKSTCRLSLLAIIVVIIILFLWFKFKK